MSDTSTSTIDEKKGIYSSSAKDASKVMSFVTSVAMVIAIILLYFSGGALMLFLCKLAQSNILPTELNCAPYTDSQPVIRPSPIQTNIFTTYTDPEMSMKLQIPYDINSKYQIIDMFKKYKESPSSSFLANYFISIIDSLFQFNYASINSTMNSMNSIFPEGVIICLGPIISVFMYALKIFLNVIYFVYLWFSNMTWFLKTNKNDSGDGNPQWENVSIITPFNWFTGVGFAFLFSFLLMMWFPILLSLPLMIYHYVLFSTMFYKAILNGKQIMSFAIIIETFKYYKLTMVSIISLCIILLAFSKLGSIAGVCSIVTLCLVYYGFISMDLFKSIPEKNLTPSVSYEQAEKTCSAKMSTKFKQGFFNLLLGQKGGNIANELKRLGKKLA
jgi:hypothetical protein